MKTDNPLSIHGETVIVEPAGEPDLPAVLNLLTVCGLPIDGVKDHISTALVARSGAGIVGCAALEIYKPAALLRSVAVAQTHRGLGVGDMLVKAILDSARKSGITHIYLLTETAEDYFPRFGFQPTDRSTVPLAVQGSVEFASVCPVTARVMELRL
jgi:amino-acid N-acetyltransferase